MAVLDQIVEDRGYAPAFLRMDNGPEFIADTLQDWCRATKINTSYCDPGSPWQNGRIESFNSRLRDELLTPEIFNSMWEIRFMREEHCKNYNHYRPHSALGYMTPVEFATKWQEENLVLLSKRWTNEWGPDTSTEGLPVTFEDLAKTYIEAIKASKYAGLDVEPEAALTTPVSNLFVGLASHWNLGALAMLREHRLEGVRPDFAVTINGHPCGWVELKAPGHSIDGTRWSGRERSQWALLAKLDALIVTNGEKCQLYSLGVAISDEVELPSLDIDYDSGPLLALMQQFISFRPEIIKSVAQLAHRMAPLARLLRERLDDGLNQSPMVPEIKAAFDVWQEVIHASSTKEDFVSSFAQVIAYGLTISALEQDSDLNKDGTVTVLEARAGLKVRHPVLSAALGPVLDITGLEDYLSAEIGALERLVSVIDTNAINAAGDLVSTTRRNELLSSKSDSYRTY